MLDNSKIYHSIQEWEDGGGLFYILCIQMGELIKRSGERRSRNGQDHFGYFAYNQKALLILSRGISFLPFFF